MNKLIPFYLFALLFSLPAYSRERETGGETVPMKDLYSCHLTNASSGPQVSIRSDKLQQFFAVAIQISSNTYERHDLNLVSDTSDETVYGAENISVVIEKNEQKSATVSLGDSGLIYGCSLGN